MIKDLLETYLWVFLWVASLPLGSLIFLMIYQATGGKWALPILPAARAAASTTPLLLLAFIPVGLGMAHLFPWAGAQAELPIWEHRSGWINPVAFWLRGIGALAVWSLLSWKMQQTERTPDIQQKAAVGLAFTFVAGGVLSVDWLMSLDEHFFSTMIGLILLVAWAVTAYSFLLLNVRLEHPGSSYYDAGGLLLAQVMLLSYLQFSQLLIVWSGNLPPEIGWYQSRVWGAWMPLALLILMGGLFLPFLVLLLGPLKRDPKRLRRVAGLVFCFTPLHFLWLVAPSFHPDQMSFELLYLVLPLIVGGLWFTLFRSLLRKSQVHR